jgi:hypothetical protein
MFWAAATVELSSFSDFGGSNEVTLPTAWITPV